MKTRISALMAVFVVIVLVLGLFGKVRASEVLNFQEPPAVPEMVKGLKPLDKELAKPPVMSIEDLVLADRELLPENVNRLFVAYASNPRETFVMGEDSEESPTVELVYSSYRSKGSANSLNGVSLYTEVPIGNEGYSVWLSGYKDPAFTGNYLGLAKKFGNWQLGIGTGNVHYGDMRHTVMNPWLYYYTDDLEAYLHAEHYGREEVDPWWYKGYVEWKVNDWGFGFYGEKLKGFGPEVSVKVNDHVKVSATSFLFSRPKGGWTEFLLRLILSF